MTEAYYWYGKAAQVGNASAMYELGNMYMFGKGVPRNKKAAYKWYSKAAELGEPKAIEAINSEEYMIFSHEI